MSVLSSASYLHLLDKTQKIVRKVNTVVFSVVHMKMSEQLHLTGTVSRSCSAVGGAAAERGGIFGG